MDIKYITPVGARILVEKIEVSQTTDGLEMSVMGNMTPVVGKVLRAGSESKFKEGDTVFFKRYSVDELKFTTAEGEQCLSLCEDEDIVAVYNESITS